VNDAQVREAIVAHGRSLFARGYSPGTSGNLSARLEDRRYVMTPTNVSLGDLTSDRLSLLDADGRHLDGPAPTKEAWLHMAVYAARPEDKAVVHLHSTYSTALSCRSDLDPVDMLPPLTPYVVMRVGAVALVPYGRPGDQRLGPVVAAHAARHRAVLLANHGPVVAGRDVSQAVAVIEELEETARLFFMLEGRPHRVLSPEAVEDLRRVFGS
jgi:ribulose-5-phosphate 4-epimerase/fuculose-1-phosphate aldolase